MIIGAPDRNRTYGLHIRSVLLYPLSYWRMSFGTSRPSDNNHCTTEAGLFQTQIARNPYFFPPP